jgi:hypothetical protein
MTDQPLNTLPPEYTEASPNPDAETILVPPGLPDPPLPGGENQLTNADFMNYSLGATAVPGYTLGTNTALLVVTDPVPLHGPNCVRLTRTSSTGTAVIQTATTNRGVVDPLKYYTAQVYYLPGSVDRTFNFYIDWYNSSAALISSYQLTHRSAINITPTAVGNSTVDGDLSPSTTYYYVITRVVSSGEESAPSAQFSATTGAAQTSIDLSWTTTNTDTAMYRVYRSTTSGGPYELVTDVDPTDSAALDFGLPGIPKDLVTTRVNKWTAFSTAPTKPPTGAVAAGIRFEVSNVAVGEYHYIDSFQLQEGVSSAFTPKVTDEVIARAVRSAPTGATGARFDLDPTGLFFEDASGNELFGLDVTVPEARFKGTIEVGSELPRIGGANLLANPSFELAAVSGGTPTGHQFAANSAFTQSLTAVGRTGGYCGILSSTVTGNCSALINNANRPAVDADEPHVGSVYVRREAGTARQARLDLVFYKSDGTLAGSNSTVTGGIATGTAFTVTDTWERAEIRAVAPSDAASARITVNYLSATANTDKLRIDDAQLEEADIAAAFTPVGGQTAGKVKSAIFEGSTFRIMESSTVVGELDGTDGLEFTAGTSLDASLVGRARKVQWRDTGDALVAETVGIRESNTRRLAVSSEAPAGGYATTLVEARKVGAADYAYVNAAYDSEVAGLSRVDAAVSYGVDYYDVTIIDTERKSSFVQLYDVPHSCVEDYGSQVIAIAAGAFQNTATINHNIGSLFANMQVSCNNAAYIVTYESNTINSFVIRVRHRADTVGAVNVNVSWRGIWNL